MFALQMDKYTVYPNLFLFFLLLKQIETNMSSNYTLMYGSLNGKNTLRSSPISLACFMGNVMRKTTGSRAIPATIPQFHPSPTYFVTMFMEHVLFKICSFDTFQYIFNLATIHVYPLKSPQISSLYVAGLVTRPTEVDIHSLRTGSHGNHSHRW